MALDQLVGSTTQNGPIGMLQPLPGEGLRNNLLERRNSINGFDFGNPNPVGLQPSPPSVGQYPPSGIASIGNQLPQLPFRPPGLGGYDLGGPIRPPHYISPMPVRPQPPMLQPIMPDYSSQFEKFGEQLTGFGDQMTGYQDALGSFNEQVGGMGKQFETITNRLDSVDKGLGSLGNQIASLEQAQPQQVMQPQRPAFNQFNPFGFGGLGSLFMRR
jgi:hypothetical protein